ncbi:uncharacterized protein BJX67DRAFT_346925 [Aspergillus lucknowensis]|uniref:Uncharacterized protein n=1 Tax=Aspergillus lucknowensis TaxID=176173 RepID=A0ABR4M2C7_9EURO
MADGQDIPHPGSHGINHEQTQDNRPTQDNGSLRKISDTGGLPPPYRTGKQTNRAGMSDEDLWRVVRRFNKQVCHVQAIPRVHEEHLDLNRTAEEQFPPEKLQRTIERFYTSVIMAVNLLFGYTGRLRSWNDSCRTGLFAAVYFLAWVLDLLIPASTGFLVALIFCPSISSLLFPKLPETHTVPGARGNEPKQDTIHHTPPVNGDRVEPERVITVSGGTDPTSPSQGDSFIAADSPSETLDLTIISPTSENEPEKLINKTNPALNRTMRILSDVTDLCERISNLLSPSPPFDLVMPRLRLAGILILMCLASLLLSSYAIVKVCGLTIGLGLFGDPVFRRAVEYLDHNVPNWKEYLDIERTLLKGVPTNAQLALTLLRIGEKNATPLVAQPGLRESKPIWQIWRKESSTAAIEQGDKLPTSSGNGGPPADTTTATTTTMKSKPKKWRQILKFARRAIVIAIKGRVALDRALAITGSGYAKGLLTILDGGNWIAPASLGPHTFEAKFERKRGTAVIDSSKEQPILYFTSRNAGKLEDLRVENQKTGSVMFQIAVEDITELKKTEGLGWKGKLIVQLAVGSEDSADGLIIGGREAGQTYHLTGMRGRNQLFNRLVTGGAQFWEMH